MASILGGALVSASMEMLVKKVVSGEFVDLFRRTKLDFELLEKLKITMLSLQSLLHDAEEKVCFEMHDLINDLAMEVSSPYCTALDKHKPDIRVRYLAYDRFQYNSDDKFEKLHGLKGLPSSLKELRICDCPLLELNLRRKQGKEWTKISYIPKIYVNYEII